MKEDPLRYTNPFLSDDENHKVNFRNNPEHQHNDFPSKLEDEKLTKTSAVAPFNVTAFYTDKSVIECESPESIVCCNESAFRDVKDICVDQGTPPKIPIEKGGNEQSRPSSVDADLCFGTKENGVKNASESRGEEQQDQPLASPESVLKSSDIGVNDVDPNPRQILLVEITRGPLEETETETEEPRRHRQTIKIPNENIASNFDTKKPETNTSHGALENPGNVHKLSLETQNVASDNVVLETETQGESSFHRENPVSGHINFTGPVVVSGSISLRSDSSTTSTRSFAFPVFQTEGNSSPVRMAKAERKRSRRWGQGLLCCKF